MASSYLPLIKKAIVLLGESRCDETCEDDILGEVSKHLEDADVQDEKFVIDVLTGCTEHKKLLDVVVDGFYEETRKVMSERDHCRFTIIAYLMMFALDDLGFEKFRDIIISLDIKKMHCFLNFFSTHLTSTIQNGWNDIYEASFVETNWIVPLLKWRPEINNLVGELSSIISDRIKLKKAPVVTTVPQEFAITKPKVQPVPWPELIPLQERWKPVPKSTYTPPKEKAELVKIKEKNLRKAEELLYEANLTEPKCANSHKSERAQRAITQILNDLESTHQFNSFKSAVLPSTNKPYCRSVRQNNAAIARRKALYDHRMKEELDRVEQLVQGVLDPSSFAHSHLEPNKAALKEIRLATEQKHLEARIRKEETALVRKQITERNHKTAKQIKDETAQMIQKYAEKRLREEEELRELIRQSSHDHMNSRIAREKLFKFKQNIVKEVSEQNRELLRRALEEEQAKFLKRIELIQQIHTIESAPRIKLNLFDDTKPAGHDILEEMSLAELKERLALAKATRQREEQEKRSDILAEKQMKKQQQDDQLEAFDILNKAMAKASATRKHEKKAKKQFVQEAVETDEKVLALKKKLEEIKEERRKWRETEKNMIKFGSQKKVQSASDSVKPPQLKVKETYWEDLERKLSKHVKNVPNNFSIEECDES